MVPVITSLVEYIPFGLFSMILLSDYELRKHSLNVCCNWTINIITIVIFYITILYFEKSKTSALIIAMLFCIITVFLKNRYIFKKQF